MSKEEPCGDRLRDKRRRMDRLLEVFGGRCWWCKCEVVRRKRADRSPNLPYHATRDHFIPRSQGGSNALNNLVLSCHACNHSRADREADDWFKHVNCDGYTQDQFAPHLVSEAPR